MNGVSIERFFSSISREIDQFAYALVQDRAIAKIASRIIKGLGIGLMVCSIGLLAGATGAKITSIMGSTPFKVVWKKIQKELVPILGVAIVKAQIVSFGLGL